MCICNFKEVEVIQRQIEVGTLKKDMDIVQRQCRQLVTLLFYDSAAVFYLISCLIQNHIVSIAIVMSPYLCTGSVSS